MQSMPPVIKRILQRMRFLFTRFGYDIRKAEENGWPDQQALLENCEVKNVLDVGANSGIVTARYRQLFPSAKVHCFEPMPKYFELLKDRFAGDEKVVVHQGAVSAESGFTQFCINAAPDTSSLLSSDLEHVPESYTQSMAGAQMLNVRTFTLDEYWASQGNLSIDILKMDIQGGELGALRGAESLLKERKIRVIYTEVYFLPFYKDQALFGEIAAYLSRFGYVLHGIYSPTFSGGTGRLQWADAIFVCPELQAHAAQCRRLAMR
jgi:FkbM family methyltransferase